MHLNPSPSEKQSIQHRIQVLSELAGSLEQAQRALLQSNLEELRGHTTRQHELCHLLGEISGEASRQAICLGLVNDGSGGQMAASARERWNALGEQLQAIERRVAQLNYSYGALLRRARRTVDIFCRVLTNSGVTYAPPQQRGMEIGTVKE